jgi:hypothetical protein
MYHPFGSFTRTSPLPITLEHPVSGSILKTSVQTTDSAFGIKATASCADTVLLEELAAKTELDYGQCKALVATLTREFAFNQGPPGTGKSYIALQIMRILLAIKKTAALGPIIVV